MVKTKKKDPPPKEADKGERILFSKGPHAKKLGWLNQTKGATAKQKYVIVDLGEGKIEGTRVYQETICTYDESEPTCVEEAAMQAPTFLATMNKYAWLVAKYNIKVGEDCKLFQKFAFLVEEKKALLRGMGEDADWKFVTFKDVQSGQLGTNITVDMRPHHH